MKNKKVCYVLCYRDPNYIRSTVLISALKKINDIELMVIKNKHRGPARYLEVPAKLLWARLKNNPDIFIVGFRGHEVFWLLYPSMAGKKIIFDEFINLHDWLVDEHQKIKNSSLIVKVLDRYVRWIIRKSRYVLTDTTAHARLSEKIYQAPANKLVVVPVSTDESTFYPRHKVRQSQNKFEVFFFGSMLPLHGIEVLLEAIRLLSEERELGDMHFTFAGGKGNSRMLNIIRGFIKENNLEKVIRHLEWIPYNELPNFIAAADLCIGGPLGDTGQARRVITGKTCQFLAMAKATLVGMGENDTGFIDKQNCLVVGLGSAREIAGQLRWAASNKNSLGKIGEKGRRLYNQRFSQQIVVKVLKGLLNANPHAN